MTYRSAILFFLLTLSSQNIWAGDTISKYIVIDTVVFEKEVDIKKLFADRVYLSILSGNGQSKIETDYISDYNSKLGSKIVFYHKDSLSIDVVMDDRGSVISLNNLEKLKDTVRIPKWVIYHNDLPDSVLESTDYFHRTNDSSSQIYKSKESNSFTGNNLHKKEQLSFVLNGVYHEVPLQTARTINCFIGYGNVRKRDGKKEKKNFYMENRPRWHKYNTKSISHTEKHMYYKGTLAL